MTLGSWLLVTCLPSPGSRGSSGPLPARLPAFFLGLCTLSSLKDLRWLSVSHSQIGLISPGSEASRVHAGCPPVAFLLCPFLHPVLKPKHCGRFRRPLPPAVAYAGSAPATPCPPGATGPSIWPPPAGSLLPDPLSPFGVLSSCLRGTVALSPAGGGPEGPRFPGTLSLGQPWPGTDGLLHHAPAHARRDLPGAFHGPEVAGLGVCPLPILQPGTLRPRMGV